MASSPEAMKIQNKNWFLFEKENYLLFLAAVINHQRNQASGNLHIQNWGMDRKYRWLILVFIFYSLPGKGSILQL